MTAIFVPFRFAQKMFQQYVSAQDDESELSALQAVLYQANDQLRSLWNALDKGAADGKDTLEIKGSELEFQKYFYKKFSEFLGRKQAEKEVARLRDQIDRMRESQKENKSFIWNKSK